MISRNRKSWCKIFKINNNVGLTGSGDELHINIVVDKLKKDLPDISTSDDLYKNLNGILLDLHKEHNTNRSKLLGYTETKTLFHPSCLIGAKCSDGYFLYYLREDAWVEPIHDYKVVGSGKEYARLMIDQQSRFPRADGKSLSDLEIGYNTWLTMFTINEIKKFDNQTGGSINIAYISNEGFNHIQQDIINTDYEKFTDELSKQIGKTFQNESIENMLKTFFKNN